MCGIAGVLLPPRRRVDPETIDRMGSTLRHRGPDFCASFCDANYGVAHTRLSILDLSPAGNQPFVDGRFSLAYNGEIYNYPDLRNEVLERGVELTGTSDTEVLFRLLILDGVGATLPRLRGMFAFSFFDSESQTVYLCRDRFGVKPLVYRYRGSELSWASEAKAMAAVTQLDIDPTRLLQSIGSIFDGRGEQTVFRHLRNVPPGSYLVARAGEPPVVHRYHEWTDEISESLYRELDTQSMPAIVQRFSELLSTSVKRMLLSDAPMGVFVSGGIDSSLIALTAIREDPDLALFTANVEGKYSEIEDARLLASSLGATLHEATYARDDLLREWPRGTWHYEAPLIAHMNSMPLGVTAELANRTGVKAVLTGEGSDELFLGYPPYVARRYRRIAAAPVDLMVKMYGAVPSIRRSLFPRDEARVDLFFPKLMTNFEEVTAEARFDEAYSFLPPSRRGDHLSSTNLLTSHLVSLLHRNDRMGMMAGIESRFPFLDEEVVRFALNLPAKFKLRRVPRIYNRRHPFLMDKAVVRAAAHEVLPRALTSKVKFGFPTYAHHSLVIGIDFFTGGFVEEAFGLSRAAEEQLVSDRFRYFGALMASVEVFGRMFDRGETADEVAEHLEEHVRVDETLNSRVAIA
jgi:asparagine synthase (glutamine-hydrolysing)